VLEREEYAEELKLLKDMGPYKLIPRIDWQGKCIQQGKPVFYIKLDQTDDVKYVLS
jgi:hypothetical protein